MSYYIPLKLYPAASTDALKMISDLTESVYDNIENILKTEKDCIPSLNYPKTYNFETDKLWLSNILMTSFYYWREYNLLGRIGENPAKDYPHSEIIFCDSTDPKYDYNKYPKTKLFKDIIADVKNLSVKNLLKEFNTDVRDINDPDNDFEDILKNESSIENLRKSLVYNRVRDILCIKSIVYESTPKNYVRITTTPLDDHLKQFDANAKLKQFIKNLH